MSIIKIDRGIAMPTANTKLPLASMDVGDSFSLPIERRATTTSYMSTYKRGAQRVQLLNPQSNRERHRSLSRLENSMTQYKNLMLDLETLGRKPGCVILSLGAVFFDPKTKTLGPEFYEVIKRDSCLKAGLVENKATCDWWAKQSAEARTVLEQALSTKTSKPLSTVLKSFKAWVQEHSVEKSNRWVWGNGASFDAPILEVAYEACGLVAPWEFWGNMCYRTQKNLHPEIKRMFEGTKHNALADATHQALHLMDMMS